MAIFAAWMVATVHALSIGFVVLGGFLGLRDLRWLMPQLVLCGWLLVSGPLLVGCPMTDLEKWLTTQGGGTPYRGHFIDHYFAGRVYPESVAALARPAAVVLVLASWAIVLGVRRRDRRVVGRGMGVSVDAIRSSPPEGDSG